MNGWLSPALVRLTPGTRDEILTALTGSPAPGARQAAVDAVGHLLTDGRSDLSGLVRRLKSLAGDLDTEVRSRAARDLDNQLRLWRLNLGPHLGWRVRPRPRWRTSRPGRG